ncbi:MAG: hypothetical protein C4520_20535 [Candidatus Abyssobacteria bacterium SURF_5]|uniref:Outer membrane protein assembly factor BamD n=1 Tax=Abyssobacteria bacterium (strain SURF_5) TaxID=2093360 RepID=A0A3A4NIG2_ABYX5|nr:MAG: hypothetical protein C4520_20535 [Candidatus Abyssubacteria bacterium SURF_5]
MDSRFAVVFPEPAAEQMIEHADSEIPEQSTTRKASEPPLSFLRISDTLSSISSFFRKMPVFLSSLVREKVGLSICAGAGAGLLMACGFLFFETGKEQWMLKQRYPQAMNWEERYLMYSQDLLAEGNVEKAEQMLLRLLQKESTSVTHADGLLLCAQTIEQLRQDESSAAEARELYERFLTRYPAEPRVPFARMQLAENFADVGYFPEANAEYQKMLGALREPEKADEIRLLLSRNHYRSRDFVRARNLLTLLIQESSNENLVRDARFLLGQTHWELGEKHHAETQMKALVRDAPGSPHAAAALQFLAQSALDEQAYQEAANYCIQWLKESPVAHGRPEVMLLLGRAKLGLNKADEAVKAASDVITFFPDSPVLSDAFMLKGEALESLARVEDSRNAFKEAAGFFPEAPLPLLELARIESEMGNLSEAIFLTERACGLDFENDSALVGLAKLYWKNGENVKAIRLLQDFTRERQLSPSIAEAFLLLADIQASLKDFDGAYKTLDRLLASGTTTIEQHVVIERQGDIYLQAGLYNDALEAYESAREKGAKSPAFSLKIARTLFEAGKFEDFLKAASSINQDSLSPAEKFDLLYLQARANAELGSFKKARREIHQAIALKTAKENFSTLALLMHINLQLGDEAEAARIHDVTRKLIGMEQAEAPFEARKIVLDWADRFYERANYQKAASLYSAISPPQFPLSDAAWALCQRGNCYFRLAQYSKAREDYSELERRYPDSEYVSVAKQRRTLLDLRVKRSNPDAGDAEADARID